MFHHGEAKPEAPGPHHDLAGPPFRSSFACFRNCNSSLISPLGQGWNNGMTKLNKDQTKKNKNYPSCGEQIFLEAIKCRYCGEFLSDKDAVEHPSIGSATESTALEPVKQTYRAKSLEEMKVGFYRMGQCLDCLFILLWGHIYCRGSN